MKASKTIWMNGKLTPWEDAKVHVLTHALHYGTGIFEGIRAYKTASGSAIFHGKKHYKRLFEGAKTFGMKIPYTEEELLEANKQLCKENNLESCYIRPLAYYGFKEMGLFPGKNPVDVLIAAWEWGTYLGEEGLEKGIRCKISSWNRLDARIFPPQTKATANYANSALAKTEALKEGYDEAILMNLNGSISEGPGENIFIVKDGHLYTPPISDNTLEGITQNSVIQIAKDLSIPFAYKTLSKDDLFNADECFFTGTAAEVTPIREIDTTTIGSGSRGPLTEKIQSAFFDIVEGKNDTYKDWLDYYM